MAQPKWGHGRWGHGNWGIEPFLTLNLASQGDKADNYFCLGIEHGLHGNPQIFVEDDFQGFYDDGYSMGVYERVQFTKETM